MTRARFRLIAAGLVAFSLVLSSCFTLRVINVSPKVLGPGGVATVKLKLYPVSTSTASTMHVVLLIGLQDLDFGTVSEFDKKGNFGGPLARVSDDAARTVMLGAGECIVNGAEASAMAASFERWRVYRTTAAINSSSGALGDQFKVNIEVEREAGTANDSFGSYVVFSAAWADDGDAVPETGEFICTGEMGGSVAFQP